MRKITPLFIGQVLSQSVEKALDKYASPLTQAIQKTGLPVFPVQMGLIAFVVPKLLKRVRFIPSAWVDGMATMSALRLAGFFLDGIAQRARAAIGLGDWELAGDTPPTGVLGDYETELSDWELAGTNTPPTGVLGGDYSDQDYYANYG